MQITLRRASNPQGRFLLLSGQVLQFNCENNCLSQLKETAQFSYMTRRDWMNFHAWIHMSNFRPIKLTEVVLYRTVCLVSKIRSQNVHFHHSFWREQNVAATKLFLSLTRIDFVLRVSRGPYAFLVGPYVFFRPYHFDAYGPHTGPFFFGFPRKLRAGPYGSYDNYIYCIQLTKLFLRREMLCKILKL